MPAILEPPKGFVDAYGTSSFDDPPIPPDDVGDGGHNWKDDGRDPIFLDLFLFYGSWFLLAYNSFFATAGVALCVFAP